MINDLTATISNISDEDLNKLFEEVPDNGVTPNNLGVQKDQVVKVGQDTDIPQLTDLDDLVPDEGKELPEKPEVVDEGKDKKKGEEEEKAKVEAEAAKKKAEEDAAKAKETPEAQEAIAEVLTNTVNFLVDKGVFKDFEGREDMKFTPEIYAELVEKQVEAIVEERYGGKKKSTGDYGEAILDYIEKGGDPDQIIDLFKEQKAVEQLDITDDESKKELVVKWYKEQHGWKAGQIKRHVDLLLAEEGALDEEVNDIKGKYKQHHESQLAALRQEQDAYQEELKRRQKEFESKLTKEIDTKQEFDDKRKKFLKNSIFNFRKTSDGTPINDFYVKFAEWQSNPASYIELAEFIMDKEGYLKRYEIAVKNKVVDKTFNFVKGNSAVSKTKGSKHVESDNSPKHVGTDFSLVFK